MFHERRKTKMDEKNRELLAEVITKNLEGALHSAQGTDEEKVAFRQAMEAIDRQSAISKNDEAFQEHTEKLEAEKEKLETIEREKIEIEKQKIEIEKLKMELEKSNREREEEFKRAEAKKTWIFKGIEIAAVSVVAPVIHNVAKKGFAKMCMLWEDEHTFTSTPGKSVRDFFKWK